MVSFNTTSQLFHDDSNVCWVPLELTFIASAVITRMRMRCYGHMAHGTSPLYTSVQSLRDLHSLGSLALGCVNSIETCTLVHNLHVRVNYHFIVGMIPYSCYAELQDHQWILVICFPESVIHIQVNINLKIT